MAVPKFESIDRVPSYQTQPMEQRARVFCHGFDTLQAEFTELKTVLGHIAPLGRPETKHPVAFKSVALVDAKQRKQRPKLEAAKAVYRR